MFWGSMSLEQLLDNGEGGILETMLIRLSWSFKQRALFIVLGADSETVQQKVD